MKPYTEIRRDLHQIPELGFQEFKTQKYLLGTLQSLQTDFMEITTWKTGIFVRIKGINPAKTIGYRADIDGLPITEETGYPFASIHEGKMHACGHDFHMTIALGVIEKITKNRIKDDVVVLFQPAEESPGGALPMMESDTFISYRPDMIFALHIAPEYPVGTIATKPGILFASTSELFIDFSGKGGHAAKPHQTRDMVVAASYFVTGLQSIVARNVDPIDSAVVTIGKMKAGTVQNVIAEQARLEGTMRSLSAESMALLKARIEQLAKGTEEAFQCKITIDYGSSYYQVTNEEQLTKDFMSFAKTSDMNLIVCDVKMTGEDFGYMLRDIPGFMFWLGVNSPYDLHHAKLQPDESVLGKAIDFITQYLHHIGN